MTTESSKLSGIMRLTELSAVSWGVARGMAQKGEGLGASPEAVLPTAPQLTVRCEHANTHTKM